MKFLISVLLINMSILSYAQIEKSEDYNIKSITILKSGAILYETPSTQSKELCKIPFWKIVLLYGRDYNYKTDTIKGIPGNWYKAKFENNFGYVFSGFIDNSINETDFKYRILSEYGVASDLNYEPNLNWYGIYKTKYTGEDSLVKVDVHFERIKSDLKGSAITVVRTNLSYRKKSQFLIGCSESLKEKIINNYLIQRTGKENSLVLYPGVEFSLLQVTGCVSKIENGRPEIPNYKIEINKSDITQYFRKRNASFFANIYYAGDIDSDNIDDYIIIEYTSYSSGVIHLFLSKNSNNLTNASELNVYNEH